METSINLETLCTLIHQCYNKKKTTVLRNEVIMTRQELFKLADISKNVLEKQSLFPLETDEKEMLSEESLEQRHQS